jgi:hypothetical protein
MELIEYRCDCTDCSESNAPCAQDCDFEFPCEGCNEARLEREEIEFTIDCVTGRA